MVSKEDIVKLPKAPAALIEGVESLLPTKWQSRKIEAIVAVIVLLAVTSLGDSWKGIVGTAGPASLWVLVEGLRDAFKRAG